MLPRILLSAYACEPGKGSEPGVGWNFAQQMAEQYEIWVITRANNRSTIEAVLSKAPRGTLHFVYYDLPLWARWWKRGTRGVQLYYYLWQMGIYRVARKLHADVEFDLAHHLTFGKYWSPSFLPLLPIPFIWGPVGGGESAPRSFWASLGTRGMMFEILRESARRLAESDPFVRLTVRRSSVILAKSPETAIRLKALGANGVRVFGESAISREELEEFSQHSRKRKHNICRFISIGRLLRWKGFALGLQGFALALRGLSQTQQMDVEYWIIGDGPDLLYLQNLSRSLGIARHVRFFSALPRQETLRKLAECQVLVHPSLHDSGGWVCLEAMAAAKPVICLDLGGPGTQVTEKTGFKVFPGNPTQVIHDIATAMGQLAMNAELRKQKGELGWNHVELNYLWDCKQRSISNFYEQTLQRVAIES
jgi:glycosyltransferase involved in cell wall biosynthesis